MKKVFLLFLTVCVFSTFINTNAAVKRVLLEQHTGTWCGWCVDGTVVMDQILAQYPDQVIGVKVHNGDAMVIPEQGQLATKLGINFYPSGMVDRRPFNDSIALSRTSWMMHCAERLLIPPKVDVQLLYYLDKPNRILYAKVIATMLETVSEPLYFNTYICEDDVTGTGSGYDQKNFLSKLAGYENNPYYNQPALITGYHHMKVVRKMLGGAFGVQGEFTVPAQQDNVYTQLFSAEIPPEWNIDKLWSVGLVQVGSVTNNEIVNCIKGTEVTADLLITKAGPDKGVVPAGTSFNEPILLKNVSSTAKTYEFILTKSSTTPADWVADLSEGGHPLTQLTLEPNAETTINLSLTPGPTHGIGRVRLDINTPADPYAFKYFNNLTVISSEINHWEVLSAGQETYTLLPILNSAGYNDFYNIVSSDYTLLQNDLNRDVVIWNTGVTSTLTDAQVDDITNTINSSKGVFLCGQRVASTTSVLPNFGVQYNGVSTQGFGTSPWQVWLSGVDNDPISGVLGNSVEGNLISYLITLVQITDQANTKSFMHFKNAGKKIVYNSSTQKNDTTDISGEDAIFGVRVQKPSSRAVLLAITPNVVKNLTTKQTLVKNIIDWILGVTAVEENEVAENGLLVSPNPVNDRATISYTIGGDRSVLVKMAIYNSSGVKITDIANGIAEPGDYEFNFDRNVPSGAYFILMNVNGKNWSQAFSVIK